MILTGLSARAIGGQRWAQLVAAAAIAVSGFSLFNGGFMSYSSFDYFWWVLAGYSVARLLGSQDPRWWLGVGAAIGLGLMTRYTIGVLVLGILGGLLLTPARRYFRYAWFWVGAALALLICLPNFLWQMHHHFIWLRWFHSIHARDIRGGSTDYFLLNQLWKTTNPVTVPLWVAGLWYLFRKPEGKSWRLLGWTRSLPPFCFSHCAVVTITSPPPILCCSPPEPSSPSAGSGLCGRVLPSPFVAPPGRPSRSAALSSPPLPSPSLPSIPPGGTSPTQPPAGTSILKSAGPTWSPRSRASAIHSRRRINLTWRSHRR